jgi:hypothetical protein
MQGSPWQVVKSLYLKRVTRPSGGGLWFCQIQLLPDIQSVESLDIKCPALTPPLPYFEMQQNRRKYWLKLRHSPGTKDLQLCYLNLYIFMYFIVFLNLP